MQPAEVVVTSRGSGPNRSVKEEDMNKKRTILCTALVLILTISIAFNLINLFGKRHLIFYRIDDKIHTANMTTSAPIKTAIKVAMAYINTTTRGKSQSYEPYQANYNEQDNVWTVYGTIPQRADGSAPFVLIDKVTGAVISLGF